MADMLAKENYKPLLAIQDKQLNIDSLHQYHLAISLGDSTLQICCIDKITHRCLLLEEYGLKGVRKSDYLGTLEELYQQHALLIAGFWSAVTICIKNQKYTLVPTQLLQEDTIANYVKVACPVDTATEVIKYFTHQPLEAAVSFAIERSILDWFQKTYSRAHLQVIHQASSFIEGVRIYIKMNKLGESPKVFVLAEPDSVHITVMHRERMLYYNRFIYQDSNEFLNYILIVIQALNLNPNWHEVIFWGIITKDSLAYRKACNYIRNITLGKRPPHLRFRYFFDKIATPAYFDIFNAHLC